MKKETVTNKIEQATQAHTSFENGSMNESSSGSAFFGL
jgi:hypothetical protein